MNRGIARRSLFETTTDARKFLALLACAVREPRIELHAYVIMLTHFHLLVRSVDGNLSGTMRRVQNAYVRWFNRSRKRDGPLVRGRFKSIPVQSRVYARTLVRYIDQNPIEARVAGHPRDYPHGSAREHRLPTSRRRVLSRSLVDSLMLDVVPTLENRAAVYDSVFAPRLTEEQRAWIERRISGPCTPDDALDDLLAASSEGVCVWARRKALLADGTRPSLAVVTPMTIDTLVAAHRAGSPWTLRVPGFHAKDGWEVVRAALLRDLAGASHAAIARRLGRSAAYPAKLVQVHRAAVGSDDEFAARYARLVQACLQRVHETD